jgi:hypothetical protein
VVETDQTDDLLSIATRKEWEKQISWQPGTIPFGDGVLESFKTSGGGSNRSNRRFVICNT